MNNKELIEELRNYQSAYEFQSGRTEDGYVRWPDMAERAEQYKRYADELEAAQERITELEAERDEWRRKFTDCHPIHLDGVQRAFRAEAERDTLATRVKELEMDLQFKRRSNGRLGERYVEAERERQLALATLAAITEKVSYYMHPDSGAVDDEVLADFAAILDASPVKKKEHQEEFGVRPLDEEWHPGDACGSCGSTKTYLDDDMIACCRSCGRSDADE